MPARLTKLAMVLHAYWMDPISCSRSCLKRYRSREGVGSGSWRRPTEDGGEGGGEELGRTVDGVWERK